jgi:hypothetical protein
MSRAIRERTVLNCAERRAGLAREMRSSRAVPETLQRLPFLAVIAFACKWQKSCWS